MITRCVLALALVVGCSKPADDCQRAADRLARIAATKGQSAAGKTATDWMLEACRTGKHAAHDPVLRCAMDSPTDEAASACIDHGLKDVVTPSAGGSGLNPLLQ